MIYILGTLNKELPNMRLKLDDVFTKAEPPERKYVGLDPETIEQIDSLRERHDVATRIEVVRSIVAATYAADEAEGRKPRRKTR